MVGYKPKESITKEKCKKRKLKLARKTILTNMQKEIKYIQIFYQL